MNSGFRYYPEKLFSKPVKMYNGLASVKAFGMSKPVEIFYSIKDGNWSDMTVWETVSGRPNKLPTSADDVYVRTGTSVVCDTTVAVNNLFISGRLSSATNSISLSVNGDILCTGFVSFTSNINLILYGTKNYINNFSSGTTSFLTYARLGDQPVMDLSYRHLTITGTGSKYLTSNLIIAGNTSLQSSSGTVGGCALQLGNYDCTFTGTTVHDAAGGTILKSGTGNIIFVGLYQQRGFGNQTLDFSGGNPTVELRGGISMAFSSDIFRTGTSRWTFTTNNQTLTANSTIVFDGDMLVSGAITVTQSTGLTYFLVVNGNLDGDNAASKFVVSSNLVLNSITSPMTTGIFDYLTISTSCICYNMLSNITLPYTTYNNLAITNGNYTKTLAGNTTVNSELFINTAKLECSTFDLSVSGGLSMGRAYWTYSLGAGDISKTGAGNILVVGVWFEGISVTEAFTGNPNIEMRGGVQVAGSVIRTGTPSWKFTTNNQSWQMGSNNWPGNILISGAITVTIAAGSSAFILGTIDGNNAASTLDNRTTTAIGTNYQNATRPMVTGILQCNAALNTWKYDLVGAQDITGGTYRNLELSGSGAKTLQGNVSVINTYTLTAPATLNSNGFALTNP